MELEHTPAVVLATVVAALLRHRAAALLLREAAAICRTASVLLPHTAALSVQPSDSTPPEVLNETLAPLLSASTTLDALLRRSVDAPPPIPTPGLGGLAAAHVALVRAVRAALASRAAAADDLANRLAGARATSPVIAFRALAAVPAALRALWGGPLPRARVAELVAASHVVATSAPVPHASPCGGDAQVAGAQGTRRIKALQALAAVRAAAAKCGVVAFLAAARLDTAGADDDTTTRALSEAVTALRLGGEELAAAVAAVELVRAPPPSRPPTPPPPRDDAVPTPLGVEAPWPAEHIPSGTEDLLVFQTEGTAAIPPWTRALPPEGPRLRLPDPPPRPDRRKIFVEPRGGDEPDPPDAQPAPPAVRMLVMDDLRAAMAARSKQLGR